MREKGMTLVELMVVMVVASIIGIAVINMFTLSNRTFMDQNRVIDVQREGRLVIDYLNRVLRETGLNPLGRPDFQGIVEREASGYKLKIDRDANVNGVLDKDSELITFQYDAVAGILMRDFNEGAQTRRQTIAKNIADFKFTYYDATDTDVTTDMTKDVRSIEVTLEFQDDKSIGGTFTRTYRSRVDLRNF